MMYDKDAEAAQRDVQRKREQEMLSAALPCPFCGGRDLTVGYWCVEEGEFEAIECANRQCLGGAPFPAWQRRA